MQNIYEKHLQVRIKCALEEVKGCEKNMKIKVWHDRVSFLFFLTVFMFLYNINPSSRISFVIRDSSPFLISIIGLLFITFSRYYYGKLASEAVVQIKAEDEEDKEILQLFEERLAEAVRSGSEKAAEYENDLRDLKEYFEAFTSFSWELVRINSSPDAKFSRSTQILQKRSELDKLAKRPGLASSDRFVAMYGRDLRRIRFFVDDVP